MELVIFVIYIALISLRWYCGIRLKNGQVLLLIFKLEYIRKSLPENHILKFDSLRIAKGYTKKETRKFNPSFLMTKKILGIVFISGGSSWACELETVGLEVIASRAAKNTKRSWKHLFKFRPEYVCPVHLYDVTKSDGLWTCHQHGVIHPILKNGKIGKKPCKFIKTINVVL